MPTDMTIQEALRKLNLSPGASERDVKRAYRDLMPSVHPDLATDDDDRRRREGEATMINLALVTLRTSGTGVPTPPRKAPVRPPEPAKAPRQPNPPPTTPKQPEAPVGPVYAPVAPAEPLEAKDEPAVSESPFPANSWELGRGLGYVIFPLGPWILLSMFIRAFGFWSVFMRGTIYEAAGPTGGLALLAGLAVAALAAVLVAQGAGKRGTRRLAWAVVIYGAYTELLQHFGVMGNIVLFGLLVALPVYLRWRSR